jgi:glycine cleavage system H protein
LSNIPGDLRYTKSHEWLRAAHGAAPGATPDGVVEIGISDHAQSALGDLVFVEVPEVGRALAAGEPCAVVESVKAASDVYSPVSGKVIASNAALATQPELLNQDPYGAGWMFRVQTNSPPDSASLMSASDYANYLADEAK